VEERVMAAKRLTSADAVVVLEELDTRGGQRLAIATLNAEKTLNSLSLAMIEVLRPALATWQRRDDVVAILIRGAGERAFCAGGDIQALYRAMTRNADAGRAIDDYCERFFEAEYRLDYALHTCSKPVLTFGHGVVMGGGLGIFSASRFRLVTEKTRIAMPEVTIGLFPDAGASWTLRNVPRAHALFLGATGSTIGGGDVLHLGIATHAVAPTAWDDIVAALVNVEWAGAPSDAVRIEACLASRTVTLAPGPLVRHEAALVAALGDSPADAAALVRRIESLAGRDEWIDRGIAAMTRGCATTVGIVAEQVQRVAAMDLGDCFRMELVIATHCARNGEFREGVRALLIDKDNAPKWRHANVAAVPRAYVLAHFVPPWPLNPLSDLETRA
jgi:enoyl-CoA hydratase/carnithine racemase